MGRHRGPELAPIQVYPQAGLNCTGNFTNALQLAQPLRAAIHDKDGLGYQNYAAESHPLSSGGRAER
jgi:hypothetical protein